MEDATKRNKKGKKDSDAKERSRRRSDSNLVLHLLKEDQVEGVADTYIYVYSAVYNVCTDWRATFLAILTGKTLPGRLHSGGETAFTF